MAAHRVSDNDSTRGPARVIDRRNVLGLIGLGAAAAAGGGLLAGCSREAGSGGSATTGDKVASVLPRYTAMELAPPDVKGVIESIPDGYLRYPRDLRDAVTSKPATSGNTYKAIVPWWGPVPPAPGLPETASGRSVG